MYRHFAFLSDGSRWAAEATECAAEQGRFWDYYDALYAEPRRGAWTKADLKTMSRTLGLAPSFDQCVDGGRYAARIRAESEVAAARGVISTPTVFVNGERVEARTFEDLKAIVDRIAPAR